MRLGEVLTRHSIITQSQLDEALNAQLVYGGHLGTCLIELGYVDERKLGAVLSTAFSIPYAPPEAFQQVPQFVIETLPPRLAEKHHAVPLKLENKVLHVALAAPGNLAAVDELRFASGYTIAPLVSAEVRIFQALERYYGIPRRLRYVRLCDKITGETRIRAGSVGIRPVAADGSPAAGGPAAAAPAPDTRREATATLERPAERSVAPARVDPSLDELTELMCRVKDEAMLGRVFLDHVTSSLPRAILFRVKGGLATAWDSRGVAEGPPPMFDGIPIMSEPVFRLLAGLSEFCGPLPGGPAHAGFFDRLDFRPPREMVLAPAYLNDQLVALLYGDGGVGAGLPADAPSYRSLTDKLALAIGLVDLKRRLREA